jgi:hypothetical protein
MRMVLQFANEWGSRIQEGCFIQETGKVYKTESGSIAVEGGHAVLVVNRCPEVLDLVPPLSLVRPLQLDSLLLLCDGLVVGGVVVAQSLTQLVRSAVGLGRTGALGQRLQPLAVHVLDVISVERNNGVLGAHFVVACCRCSCGDLVVVGIVFLFCSFALLCPQV